jgi:hypothetical protein
MKRRRHRPSLRYYGAIPLSGNARAQALLARFYGHHYHAARNRPESREALPVVPVFLSRSYEPQSRSLPANKRHVLIDRQHLPEHRAWIAFVVLATAAAVAWFVYHGTQIGRVPGGSSAPGLAFGIAAGVIMLFELLLWPRKHFRVWRVGMVKTWLRAHIWLGLLTVPLILLHSGFSWGGPLTTVLAALFIAVIASGIYGLAMQQWLPRLMLSDLPAETIVSQIDSVSQNLCEDAEQLVAAVCGVEPDEVAAWRGAEIQSQSPEEGPSGPRYVTIGAVRQVGSVQGRVLQTQVIAEVPGSAALEQAFKREIGPFLWTGESDGSLLSEAGKAANYFRELRTALAPEAHPAVAVLESYCDQRRQFERQRRLHRWLHGWLLIHLPLSILLILLMFVHIYAALKYR